jgi:hypothetical protein
LARFAVWTRGQYCSRTEKMTDKDGFGPSSAVSSRRKGCAAWNLLAARTLEHPGQAERYRVRKETVMNSDSQPRLRVAALIYLMVNAVVFGVGLVSVLMTPTLAQHAFFWIPAIIVTSFALSAPLAWFLAPTMMMRFILARRLH